MIDFRRHSSANSCASSRSSSVILVPRVRRAPGSTENEPWPLLPHDRLGAGHRGQRLDDHLVGDDEAGVEAHAELADELRAGGALGELLYERLAAGPRDGAEVLDGLVGGEPDAVVVDGDLVLLGVEVDADAGLAGRGGQAVVRERDEPRLVEGVRRVRDELAQEYLAVGVDRPNHQVEQLLDLCLEAVRLSHAVLRVGFGPSALAARKRAMATHSRPRGNRSG